MTLRFYAREDLLSRTHHPAIGGQAARYIGRQFVAPNGSNGGAYPATNAPAEYQDGAPGSAMAIRECRDGSLWAADAETAKACSVAFVPVRFADGAWSSDSNPVAKATAEKA